MQNKRLLLLVTSIGILCIFAYLDLFYPFFGVITAAKWHVLNSDTVTCGSATVRVPLFWWQIARTDSVISLTRTVDFGDRFFGLVTIDHQTMSKEELNDWPVDRKIDDTILRRVRPASEVGVGGSSGFEVEYAVVAPPEKIGKSYWRLVIPEGKLVIDFIEMEREHKGLAMAEIVEKITFKLTTLP